jgi:RimJ/RimL family protein N-acetyltransferase
LEAVEIELATLFVHDADGWLAPDFTIARTDGAVMVRIRSDLPADLTGKLAGLGAREPANAPIDAPPAFDREYRRLLGLGDRTPEVYLAFVLERDQSDKKQPEAVDIATLERTVLSEFPGLVTDLEIGRPGFALIRDGKAVSVAFTTRSGERGAESGVDISPAYRGRGYATAVVAAWAEAVRRSGRLAFYSAVAENAASLAVGRRLAGPPYASLTHYSRDRQHGAV